MHLRKIPESEYINILSTYFTGSLNHNVIQKTQLVYGNVLVFFIQGTVFARSLERTGATEYWSIKWQECV